MPARHLPARALQWQAGRFRSGPARHTAGGEAGRVNPGNPVEKVPPQAAKFKDSGQLLK